ncbi:MAG: Sec-independent protein translocase subunit TatA [Actinobacteria bacterium]|nr:Sec-independent protein translocase subunit TatA [Actinomycetota bacterium]
MLTNMKGWEWLIIVALILLLFGAKRLPDAARGLGRSMRIFKAETKGLAGDATAAAESAPAAVESASATAPATPAADTTIPAASGEKPTDA